MMIMMIRMTLTIITTVKTRLHTIRRLPMMMIAMMMKIMMTMKVMTMMPMKAMMPTTRTRLLTIGGW